jgi:thiol:disulfide interchange protein DsbD
MKFKYSIIFSLFVFTNLFSQIELAEDKVSWDFSIEQSAKEKENCEATIIGKVKTIKDWHINAIKIPAGSFGFPTSLTFKKNPNYTLIGGVIEPKPKEKYDKYADENLAYHEGSFVFKQKIKINSSKDFIIEGAFVFQTCNEVKCLPDYTADLKIKVKACESKTSETNVATNTENSEEKNNIENSPSEKGKNSASPKENSQEVNIKNKKSVKLTDNKSLWTIFILSFLSGLAALLTPCVFPMLPMTVSFFTKQSKTKAEGIKNAVLYGISIIVIYILLGTVVTATFGADALNNMSTNPTFNIIFFLILVVFAVSFMGAFEIRMPSSWVNKADSKADKGGLIGIFFMALALALVSFSCTGPIVGTLLVQSASIGGIAPFVGMFGFSFALALPFGLFAAFPGWMNTMPKSGGWLNSVKVVLGLLELALAFKFLSNADLALQAHWLERELFLAIWIAIFTVLTLYLFGKIRLPHDSPLEKLSVGRTIFGTLTLTFVIYMIPGMWGAPLQLISAFPPPLNYSESPLGFGSTSSVTSANTLHIEGTHLGPQNIQVFHDYDLALEHAKKVNKPLFVDFTGHNCVNCRKMEQSVWGQPGIIDVLRKDVVVVSLHVDERVELPKSEQKTVTILGKEKVLKTTGDKWMYKQISEYNITSQPYYVMQTAQGENIENGSADYEHHHNASDFKAWLLEGMKLNSCKMK